ncbi:type I-E CRISPR-associated protein Cas5/CasD [Amycolatopsis lurida]
MTVLLLRLAAPLQSWGTSSRFTRRNTDRAPSKSGVIGLLAAAAGRRRSDPIEDLTALRFGVRIDQPGRVERDFQTARPVDGSTPLPLSYRFYLADAVFLAAIEGEHTLLHTLQDALRRPVFPLYLGRRSCPPAGPLALPLHEGSLDAALAHTPWQASRLVQQRHRQPTVALDTITDHHDTATGAPGRLVQDEPLSFDPRQRQHGWRTVAHTQITLPNPAYTPPRPGSAADDHDPMAILGGH